jgi:hypothetical protein
MARGASKPKNWCDRHEVGYGALDQCPGCENDPGPTPDEVGFEPAPPPTGCITSADREAWYTKLANDAIASADALGSGEDDWHIDVAVKAHRDTAIKAMRAAGELGRAREDADLVEARRRANAKEGR